MIDVPRHFRRWIRRGFSLAGSRIDRIYLDRHPGPIERALIRLAAPAVRLMYPNDRWSLPVHAPYWMQVVTAPPVEPPRASRRIFIFTAYRGTISNQLALAALLAWRGHHVTIGYLPKLRSPVKSPLADHASAPSYLKAAFSRVYEASGGRVEVVDLSQYSDLNAPLDIHRIERQAISDAMIMLGRESHDEPGDEEKIKYFRELGILAQRIFWGYFAPRCDQFDLVLIPNGATFETAHLRAVVSRLQMPFNSLEKSTFRNDRAIYHGDDTVSSVDVDLAWKNRIKLGYCEPAFREFVIAHSTHLMNERRMGSTTNWQYKLQRAPMQDAKAAMTDAGIDSTRPFALICTNVPYDAGYLFLTSIFPSMKAWLIETVRFLLDQTDLQVVVRAHPGEASYFGFQEKSEANLEKAGLLPSPRLRIIPGDATTNTYSLIEKCKFGVVFSSTVGYEMAMMGKKVIVGSEVYYGRRGFTIDASNRDDYFTKLKALATEPGTPTLSPDQMGDAALFHFMYHYVQHWPYPWHNPRAQRDLPPEVLVRSGAVRRYLPTLDSLATPPEEFRARVGDFLSVEHSTHIPKPQITADANASV